MCVGRLGELSDRGSFVARHVAGDSTFIVRTNGPGEPDAVKAFQNVCRHRGTQLCRDEHGRFQGSIQCEYHAWTYGLDGQLLGAPHMDRTAGFRKGDHSLLEVRAGLWEGFIFICLADSGPTLVQQLDDLPF